MSGFVFAASSAGAIEQPCPPTTSACAGTGVFILEGDEGTPERGTVSCLHVVGAEAFMSVGFVRGDLVDFVDVYADDRSLRQSPERDRLAMLPASGGSCEDPALHSELRQAAAEIFGDVTVAALCDALVCVQRSHESASSAASTSEDVL